jgi:hypothetical protein
MAGTSPAMTGSIDSLRLLMGQLAAPGSLGMAEGN